MTQALYGRHSGILNAPLTIAVTDAACEVVRLRNENAELRDDARAVILREIGPLLDFAVYLADELRARAADAHIVTLSNARYPITARRRLRQMKRTAAELHAKLRDLSDALTVASEEE